MASTRQPLVNVILGAAPIGDKSVDPLACVESTPEVNAFLDTFAKHGHHHIDTSRLYGSSESKLGAVSAGDRFVIDSKLGAGIPGSFAQENILEEIRTSLESLKVEQLNIAFLHVPDRATPYEEPCRAMSQACREGKIKHWGICNHSAEEVRIFIDICDKHGLVKPSVYQGHYNAVMRSGEEKLFPFLREAGMAYHAYSPAAGGLFAGNHKNIQPRGRWDQSSGPGKLYTAFYLKPSVVAAADKAAGVAATHGISGHAAALRWTAYHSILSAARGDSIIIGATSSEQLESNLKTIEQGPLPDDVVAAFEAVYEEIGVTPAYHL